MTATKKKGAEIEFYDDPNESILMNNWRRAASKVSKKIREATGDVAYPTGFITLDYMNGCWIHVKNEKKNMDFVYPSIGILDGAGTMIIGRTNCGKSSLMLQIAAGIIKQYKTSCIFYNDIEGGMADSNMEALMQMNADQIKSRMFYMNEAITIESIYASMQWVHDEKTNNRELYEYDTKLYDIHGDRIYKLEPTIFCIDSWPVLMPESLAEDDEVAQGMATSMATKSSAALVKKIVSISKAANIIILTINHIMDDIQIGPFAKKTQMPGLKQGERLPGGKTMLYLANNMLRLSDSTKLKASEGIGVDGFIVDVFAAKSRVNKMNISVPLVYTAERGFDPDASMFMFLKKVGLIQGASVSWYLAGYPDLKFSQKNFLNKLHTDPEFQAALISVAKPALEDLLSKRIYEEKSVNEELQNANVFDINKVILDMNRAEMAA